MVSLHQTNETRKQYRFKINEAIYSDTVSVSALLLTRKKKRSGKMNQSGESHRYPLAETGNPILENSGRKSLSLLLVSLTKSLKLVGSVRTIIYTFSDIAFSQCELLITIDN